jgi:HK97 family phage major capsid protein
MKTSKQLREERSAISDKIAELSKVEDLNDAQKAELRSLVTNEENFTKDIELALDLEKRAAILAGGKVEAPEKRSKDRFSISKLLSEGDKVSGYEKEMIEESRNEARAQGINPTGIYLSNSVMNSIMPEKRTMTAATDADGGFLIPTEKIDWFDALFAYSVLDKLGIQKLTGLSANTDIPGFSSAVVSGWANGETGTQSPDDPTVVNRALRPKLLYGATNISKRLAIQTNRSVDQMIMMDIMASMAQTLQAAVINGSGSSGQPTGILNTSGIQSVAMGTNGGALSFAKALELWAAIAQANSNMDNFKWLTNPLVHGKALQTSTDTGSGAMIVTYNNNFGGSPNAIANYPLFSTSSVPSTLTKGSSGAVCSALIGGDFSQVVVGQFGGVELIVDNISQARSGFTALTINQFVDVVVKQPAALGAIVDITTA